MRIYVSGPMTGIPQSNYPAFNDMASKLRTEGHEVINPAENEDTGNMTWADFMRIDISQILTVDAMFLLPGWENSKGARLEVLVAAALKHQFFQEWPHHILETPKVVFKALIYSLYHNEVQVGQV